MEEIENQIKEYPISKDEARDQFESMTKELNIKHRFDFDTAWEMMENIERKKQFQLKMSELKTNVHDSGAALEGEELHKFNPTKGTFADGLYIREIFNPAGQLIITKVHKKENAYFLMQGEMSILTEDGIQLIKAPHYGVTEVGTRRGIYTHTDCVFVTVHATDLKDEDDIVAAFTEEDYIEEDVAMIDNKNMEDLK